MVVFVNNRWFYLILILIGLSPLFLSIGCTRPTIEERLVQLTEDFPNHRSEMQELSSQMLLLFREADFSGFNPGDGTKNRPDRVIIHSSKKGVPLEEATKEQFQSFVPALNRIQQLASQLKLAYAHVETLPTDSSYLSIGITLHGGGVLGNDSGYIHLLEGKLSDYKQEGFWWKPIPDAPNWYVFVG